MFIPTIPTTNNETLAALLDTVINNKTKPLGSLGVLESLAKQIGLIQNTRELAITQPAILVFSAEHGIVAEGISAYPQDVTWQMVENFLARGAAINVFARQNNCALHVIDAGVNHDFGVRAGLIDLKIGLGTCNFSQQPVMTSAQCEQALQHGMDWIAALDADV